MKTRLITAAVALPILIASIIYPPLQPLFIVIAIGAILVALYEFWFLAKRVGAKPDIVVGYASAAALLVAFFYNEPALLLVIVPGLVIAALAAEMLRGGPFDKMILSVGSTVLGVLYVALLGGFLISVRTGFDNPAPGYTTSSSISTHLLSFFFLVLMGSDTGAYFAGRAFGKHKLAPKISPGKTWEGAIGGMLASLLMATLAHYWFFPELSLRAALPLAAVLNVLGVGGDLTESALKRGAKAKDAANILPVTAASSTGLIACCSTHPSSTISLSTTGTKDNEITGHRNFRLDGSIGCNTLSVVESFPEGRFRVVALAAGGNVSRLAAQIERHRPELVSVETEERAEELHAELGHRGVAAPRVETGERGLVAVSTHEEADCVVSAIVGAIGFVPTLRALEVGKRVALANKETLVMAGELMTKAAAASGAELLPVDSEHNALHQCLRGERREEVRRLILTASGGPFRTKSLSAMESATVAEAMRHPTWNMGAKVTIDSATLMNKGLEVMKRAGSSATAPTRSTSSPPRVGRPLSDRAGDGSVIAQLGVTDMRHAIQYALTYPERHPSGALPRLDLAKLGTLNFEPPDPERFPCLRLAYRALRAGGTSPPPSMPQTKKRSQPSSRAHTPHGHPARHQK